MKFSRVRNKKRLLFFTAFEKKVLRCVLSIPLGEVRTYAWVAQKIKYPHAQRAVGTVLRKNPFLFFIPCHRVVPSANGYGRYALGLRYKARLIKLEKKIKDMLQ